VILKVAAAGPTAADGSGRTKVGFPPGPASRSVLGATARAAVPYWSHLEGWQRGMVLAGLGLGLISMMSGVMGEACP
jgi:hypothetical protein